MSESRKNTINFRENDVYEFSLKNSLTMHRASELRNIIAQKIISLKAAKSPIPLAFKTLVEHGYLGLSVDELNVIKNEYPNPSYVESVYFYYDNIAHYYEAALYDLQKYLGENESLKNDVLRSDLYKVALEQVLPNIQLAGRHATFKQLIVLTEILERTKRGIINPSDTFNNDAYENLFKKVMGQCSFSYMMKESLTLFMGILSLTAMVVSAVWTITLCPLFIIPAFVFGITGTNLAHSAIDHMSQEVHRSKHNEYGEAANAMRMFNRYLNKHAIDPEAVKQEEASLGFRFRRFMTGGLA